MAKESQLEQLGMQAEMGEAMGRAIFGNHETTPEVVSDRIKAAAVELGATKEPVFVPVRRVTGAIKQDCYGNVEKKIALDGGEIVYGWMIYESSYGYLNIIHHAVWRSPAGELVDVSVHTEKTTCFAEGAAAFEGKMIMGRCIPTTNDAAIVRYCEITNQVNAKNVAAGG